MCVLKYLISNLKAISQVWASLISHHPFRVHMSRDRSLERQSHLPVSPHSLSADTRDPHAAPGHELPPGAQAGSFSVPLLPCVFLRNQRHVGGQSGFAGLWKFCVPAKVS